MELSAYVRDWLSTAAKALPVSILRWCATVPDLARVKEGCFVNQAEGVALTMDDFISIFLHSPGSVSRVDY